MKIPYTRHLLRFPKGEISARVTFLERAFSSRVECSRGLSSLFVLSAVAVVICSLGFALALQYRDSDDVHDHVDADTPVAEYNQILPHRDYPRGDENGCDAPQGRLP